MSKNDDKPDKLYLDEHGVLHAPSCPVTEAAWAGRKAEGCIPTTSGPAQVATEAYRDGWARIFGTSADVGQA